MKTRQLLIPVVAVIAVGVAVCLALIAYWQRPLPVMQDASKLIAAVRAFSQDRVKKGEALPDSLPLQELVKGNFITAEDVRAFDGMEVTFHLTTDTTDPKAVLIRARLPDGSQMVMLGDGTVQQLPK